MSEERLSEAEIAELIEDALSEEYGTFLDGGTPSGVAEAIAPYLAARVASAAAENAELRSRLDEVRALADGWVGFDDSHDYGDAILMVLAPAHDEGSECSCPMGLGYRFHRAPCEKAGAIDDLASAEPSDAGNAELTLPWLADDEPWPPAPSGVEGSEQR